MVGVFFGQVVETSPALTLLDGFELLKDLSFLVTTALDDFPESLKLVELNLPVVVDIHAVEKLHGAHLAKGTLPVLHSFLLINSVGVVDIEKSKHLLNSLQNFRRKFLQKTRQKSDVRIPKTLHF